jgi:hypothetical protein
MSEQYAKASHILVQNYNGADKSLINFPVSQMRDALDYVVKTVFNGESLDDYSKGIANELLDGNLEKFFPLKVTESVSLRSVKDKHVRLFLSWNP